MKFQKGDRVIILPEFWNKRHPGDPGINKAMRAMAGQTHTITRGHDVGTFETYRLDCDWNWDGDWLELEHEISDIHEEDIMNMFG